MVRNRLWALLVFLYKALRVKAWLKYAPASVREWRDRAKVKMRGKLVTEEALKPKYLAGLLRLMNKYGSSSLGDYLEFGVYHGTSLIIMHRVLEELGLDHIRLFGFDSFEGLPTTAKTDDEGHWKGLLKSEYDFTLQVLKTEKVNMDRVILTKGYYDATLNPALKQRHQLQKASVIMVDCVMYLSAKEALTFCESLIVDETMIVFDDWYPLAEKGLGEKRAFDEFLKEYPYFEIEEFGDYPPHAKVFFVKRVRTI